MKTGIFYSHVLYWVPFRTNYEWMHYYFSKSTIFMIEVVFNIKSLRPASCVCIRNMLKTWCLSLKSWNLRRSVCFRCFPPDPRMLLFNKMSLNIYATYVKGVVGLGRGGGMVVQAKESIRHLTHQSHFAKGSFSLHINGILTQNVYKTDRDRAIVYLFTYTCY